MKQGMDVERVEALLHQLEIQAGAINTVVGVVDGAVNALTSLWFGENFNVFHHGWVGGQRTQAHTAAVDISDAVSELRRQIEEQRAASGDRSSSGGGSTGGGFSGGGGGGGGGGGWGDDKGPWKTSGPDKHGTVSIEDKGFAGEKGSADKEYVDGKWRDVPEDDDKKHKGPKVGVEWKLGEVSGEYDVAKAETKGHYENGDMTADGSAYAAVGQVKGSASGSVGSDGLKGSVEASAMAAAVGAAGSVGAGAVKASGSASAGVGAKASASAQIGPTGAGVEAGAFAGAEANAKAGVDVGGLGAEGGVGVQAGIGATGRADVGMKDGKFHIGAGGSVSVGVGVKVSVDITVDPGEIAKTVGDIGKAAGDVGKNIGDAVSHIDPNPFHWFH